MSVFALCLMVWCVAGDHAPTTLNVSVGVDVYSPNEAIDRYVNASIARASVGLINTGEDLAMVLGLAPLVIRAGRLTFEGGFQYSTAPVPIRGTQWNWNARTRVRLLEALSFEWWHVSNAGHPNPSLDAAALVWSFQ